MTKIIDMNYYCYQYYYHHNNNTIINPIIATTTNISATNIAKIITVLTATDSTTTTIDSVNIVATNANSYTNTSSIASKTTITTTKTPTTQYHYCYYYSQQCQQSLPWFIKTYAASSAAAIIQSGTSIMSSHILTGNQVRTMWLVHRALIFLNVISNPSRLGMFVLTYCKVRRSTTCDYAELYERHIFGNRLLLGISFQ